MGRLPKKDNKNNKKKSKGGKNGRDKTVVSIEFNNDDRVFVFY